MNINLKKVLPLIISLSVISLVGCATPQKEEHIDAEPIITNEEDVNNVQVIGINDREGLRGDVIGAEINEMIIDQREVAASELIIEFVPIIYFELDSYNIDDKSLLTIKHYADILVDNQNEAIVLVGHTDERGSQEYNLALGERRGLAVKEAFLLYGVQAARIDVITLGEEKPAVFESNEAAWAKNRRVEIKIK